jgi:tetratricopeptide (TPR) repeat protein
MGTMDTASELVARGEAAERAGNVRQAQTYYEAATKLKPPDWMAFQRLGTLCYHTRDYDQAVPLLKQAIALNPQAPELHFRLGTCFDALGQRELAVRALQQAVGLAPDSWLPWFVIAQEHRRQGQREVAVAAYRRVLQAEPDQPDTLSDLGSLLLEMGQEAEAFWLGERAYRLCRTDPRYVTTYALAVMERGELDDAERLLREAKALDPGDRTVARALADLTKRRRGHGWRSAKTRAS